MIDHEWSIWRTIWNVYQFMFIRIHSYVLGLYLHDALIRLLYAMTPIHKYNVMQFIIVWITHIKFLQTEFVTYIVWFVTSYYKFIKSHLSDMSMCTPTSKRWTWKRTMTSIFLWHYDTFSHMTLSWSLSTRADHHVGCHFTSAYGGFFFSKCCTRLEGILLLKFRRHLHVVQL